MASKNMVSAVAAATKDSEVWCRPTIMRGSGGAFAVIDGDLCPVPYCRRRPLAPNRASVIIGEWEVVTPEFVLSETD